MTTRLLGLAIGILVFAEGSASAHETHMRGPWPLVSLAGLGTVTWRCDTAGSPTVAPGLPALALGFRVAKLGQTGSLRLIVARRTLRSRVIQPGQIVTLPFLHAPVQRLIVAEGGEDGTLHGTVTVRFVRPSVSNYCWPYMPPRVDLRLSPRH